ncbi:MAG: nitroreductase family protein [Candidatus Aminicenantales bacterium]
MSLYDLIVTRRTIRQFKQDEIPDEILEKIVNAARLAPSGSNLQPLEYIVVTQEKVKKLVFSALKWAGYIAPEGNPKPGHEPAAYVVVLVNTRVRKRGYEHDAGAAIENMILTAWEEGIGSCWVGSVKKVKVRRALKIPDHYLVDSVLALGYPAEKPVVEETEKSVKYWKDRRGRLHVPKRRLENIIHFNGF